MSQRLDYSSIAKGGMKTLFGVLQYVNQSGLPKPLVDLVFLRVSQINGCAYCIDAHSADLLKKGMQINKLVLVPVWRKAVNLFSEQEQAGALRWAESVTLVAKTGIPDDDFQATSAHFTEKELADLTIAIGLMNAYNRLAIGFRATPTSVKS